MSIIVNQATVCCAVHNAVSCAFLRLAGRSRGHALVRYGRSGAVCADFQCGAFAVRDKRQARGAKLQEHPRFVLIWCLACVGSARRKVVAVLRDQEPEIVGEALVVSRFGPALREALLYT